MFNKNSSFYIPITICLAFLLWIYLFQDFISGTMALEADAVPYFEHFKYFIDQALKGAYPLWDPTRQLPNEFFLRRIGEFNPFYAIVLLLYKSGLDFEISYLIFLTSYFFLGALGFYFLGKKIFNDASLASLGFLLLLFSSFGTLLFKSFMILLFTPMAWFFYFLLSFYDRPLKHTFLGMTFTLMILAQTYLPFYFITVFLAFLILIILLYFKGLKIFLKRLADFCLQHPTLALICLAALIASLVPGALFFQELKQGHLTFPERHFSSLDDHPLSVAEQALSMGGIPSTIIASRIFSNLNQIQLGQFYLPVFIYPLFLLAFLTKINRRLIFLSLFVLFMYLLSLYDATALYPFLYRHVFFFKYFKNFQFFLWVAILPLLILMAVEHLKIYIDRIRLEKKKNREVLFITLLHAGFFLYLLKQYNVIFSSFAVVVLSLAFFIFLIRKHRNMTALFLFVLVALQPIETYHYLRQNAREQIGSYTYQNNYYLSFRLPSQEEKSKGKNYPGIAPGKNIPRPVNAHLITKWCLHLRQFLPPEIYEEFVAHKIILYDGVQKINGLSQETLPLFLNNNMAVIDDESFNGSFLSGGNPSPRQVILQDSPQVQLIKFDANSLKLKTNLNASKFLVYYDNYYPGWQAFIDDKEVPLTRANISFKGLWVPAGNHVVYLRYGKPSDYFLKYLILAVFYLFCGYFFLETIKYKKAKLSS